MVIIFLAIFFSTTTWSSFYLFMKEKFSLEAEWCCRLITAIHAVMVTSLAMISSFIVGPWPLSDHGCPTTPLQYCILITSLGYFLFDLIWCLYYQTEDKIMYLHHLASILCLSSAVVRGVSGTETVTGLGGLELTNPLLQARWFLRSAGYKDTLAFFLVNLSFMILFFLVRIIAGSYYFFNIMLLPTCALDVKFGGAALYIVSWIFMIQIVNYFLNKYVRTVHSE